MSFMKGDLLSRTSKLVKGFAKAEPVWLKSIELISGFDPPPDRLLKEKGVSEEEAMAVADMEYRGEGKAKKKAYSRLKQIARLQGKKQPPNPYPSAIKERKFMRDGFYNPDILKIQAELQDRRGGGGWHALVLIGFLILSFESLYLRYLDLRPSGYTW
ncbi:hypothetical protein HAX54_042806 [Datura stramonium]|uniref:Uncharacterized protein n=1 Tax=Datura stramonium TaxID=4076 RepID=A0ABS8SMS9_DATST|nr:hypothetical protein [Datura stramonium]